MQHIALYCRKCKCSRKISYFPSGDLKTPVLAGIAMKCHGCRRVIVAIAKALHTTPNYLLLGEAEEESWMEDALQVLCSTKDPAMRKLALKQLKCLVED